VIDMSDNKSRGKQQQQRRQQKSMEEKYTKGGCGDSADYIKEESG